MVVVLRSSLRAWWAVPLLLLWTAAQEDPSSPDFAFPSRVRHCRVEQGHGICPWDNTCCRIIDNAAPVQQQQLNSDADAAWSGSSDAIFASRSACVPSDLGAKVATCCYDDDVDDNKITTRHLRTGCGIGYRCGSSPSHSSRRSCLADPSIIQDPLVQVLPRYHLCQFSEQSADFSKVWGFSSPTYFGNNAVSMPYYSSLGSLERLSNDPAVRDKIRAVLITVHGANRNADDYFCSATAALQLAIQQQQQQKNIAFPFESIDQVLVLAPRFMVRSDFPTPNLASRYLFWEDKPNGPWRYGASAIKESRNNNNATDVSSFQVLDAFLDFFLGNNNCFPHLQRVTVAGHSSGGQMVQRWALLSPNVDDRLRVVAANPSSYAYLSPLRYNATAHHRWAVPATDASCPGYNQWEWGLDTNFETPSYVQKVLDDFAINSSSSDQHPYQSLIDRFVTTRRVIYLQGSQDRCNVSSTTTTPSSSSSGSNAIEATVQEQPWCDSHGLETTCADQLQGSNRLERNERYMGMLQRLMLDTPRATKAAGGYHRRVVVPGVGHDHSLLFASPEGLRALFSVDSDDSSEALEQDITGSFAEDMRNYILSMKWKFLMCIRY